MTSTAANTLADFLQGSPYQSYAYSYPHKSAYRAIDPAVKLADVWRKENKESLFLYTHIPFCEFRCGFCNLFTQAQPKSQFVSDYLTAFEHEAATVASVVGECSIAQFAIGGGTPTFLSAKELERVFHTVENHFSFRASHIPTGIEVSPATVNAEKLALLREKGVDRVSIGVQSFDDEEAGGIGRPQRIEQVETALGFIRDAGFPVLNIDLIYGGQLQTTRSWLDSIKRALDWKPEEIYFYPLYVRPLTGLGERKLTWDDQRLTAYRAGRDFLLAQNYEQVSMRMFRRMAGNQPHAAAPEYRCQQDGMIGMGCGARSYTSGLHYSTEFAVKKPSVAAIIQSYNQSTAAEFAFARHGFFLSDEDQRRRHCILSLLQAEGLDRSYYRHRFGAEVLEQLPQLHELFEHSLAEITDERIQLTATGLEWSDAIGPWLNSAKVSELMQAEC